MAGTAEATRKWKIENTRYGAVMVPTFEPKCPFCGTPLVLHRFAAYNAGSFYHCDVHMKCPNDDWFTIFGVPIGVTEFNKLSSSPLNNKVLTREVLEVVGELPEEEVEKIKTRLASWGYW